MIRSMTAYGRSKQTVGGKDILIEIKSVNNRYFDCNIKISRLFGFLEEKIKNRLVQKGVSRGKVDVFCNIDIIENDGVEVMLDIPLAKSYYNALMQLGETFNLNNDVTLSRLAQYREIFTVKKAEEDIEQIWQEFMPVLDAAIEEFLLSRETEGKKIGDDIKKKRLKLSEYIEEIEKLSDECIKTHMEKLRARITQMLSEFAVEIDQNRLLTECAIYADKVAIDEEIVRLKAHMTAFDDILNQCEPQGRKLDFLIQEINRETNTIGSKAANIDIAKIVVEMKSELEKIREQIQNIE